MRIVYLFIVVLLLGIQPSTVRADLLISLDFTGFNNSAPGNASTILGGSSLSNARSVMEAAADYWEAAFANSSSSLPWAVNGRVSQTVAVNWSPLGGATLANAGTGWFVPSGQFNPGTGSLNWDSDGSSIFYVDPTPATNSEWNQSSQRSLAFNAVSMNVERVHFDAPVPIRNSNDMLSVAIHELGHTLGFLGNQYPLFANADLGLDGDLDITSGTFANAQIPYFAGHTNFQILTPNQTFPYDPGQGSFFNQFNYFPNAMGPTLVTGTRSLLTEVDIAMVGEYLRFDMNTVNFNPSITAVPEPSSMLFVAIAGIACVARARRRR